MKTVELGVCAPKGFKANGLHCGIRKNKAKKDLALIVSENLCSAAGVYTTNLVKGAPIYVTQKNIANGYAQAIVCNSGNANTCNADGFEIASEFCQIVAQSTGIKADDIIVASTGVIGQKLDNTPIRNAMPNLVGGLSADEGGALAASEAIMTTDTVRKQFSISFTIDGKECKIGGMAKGSGMIHPNMATLLVFLTTDTAISPCMLQEAISADVSETFNMVSVDGDTSTNDMLCILANGKAQNPEITTKNSDFYIFCDALKKVTTALCKMIAADGEGATKLIECVVTGAKEKISAQKAAKSVITSSLFKAAMFGADANWGRILCALGYSGASLDISKIDVVFASKAGKIAVCKSGSGLDFSEELAKQILLEKEIIVQIDLNDGTANATAWGCDLTYNYVKINGDYRS